MLQTKSGQALKQLTTAQFAEEILCSANKVLRFLIKPHDSYCFHLANIDLLGLQTVIINGGCFIDKEVLPCPGGAYAFNITCYDVQFGYADKSECIPEIIDGLNSFGGAYDNSNDTWYVVDDGEEHTIETVYR